MKRFAIAAALMMTLSMPVVAQQEEEENMSELTDMIGALYLTVAIHEYCEIDIDPAVAALIGHDAVELEEQLGLTPENSERSYMGVLASIAEAQPDCDKDGEMMQQARNVIFDYKARATLMED